MMNMLTVLTPTYNRSSQLWDLFRSLQNQTSKDFVWMIVDDGSADDTASAVGKMKEAADFPVVYLQKQNGGKHTALNLGVSRVETRLTFIVDSDDTLKEDAVKTILEYAGRFAGESGLCGFAFLRGFPDGTVNGKLFKCDGLRASYISARINSNDTMADKAEVFYTSCLREFPFPEFAGERFLGEDIVWIRMARQYDMIHVNRVIYTGTYQQDGLTRNRRRQNIASPLGCTYRAMEFMHKDIRLRYRVKGALQYLVYGRFARRSFGWLMKNSPDRFLTIVCLPASLMLYSKWKRENENARESRN